MPKREMGLAEAEGWLDYWETVGLSSDPAALDEREAARVIRAELGRLRAASAAPETSPDPTDLPGYEHLIFLHDRFTDVIGDYYPSADHVDAQTPAAQVALALLPSVHGVVLGLVADQVNKMLADLARGHGVATPPETTEH